MALRFREPRHSMGYLPGINPHSNGASSSTVTDAGWERTLAAAVAAVLDVPGDGAAAPERWYYSTGLSSTLQGGSHGHHGDDQVW
jgi:hypothetical protein